MTDAAADVLISALSTHGSISDEAQNALRTTTIHVRQFSRGASFVKPGSSPSESCFVIEGMASREMLLPQGARQLGGLYIRGDFVDLHATVIDYLDHGVIALTNIVMGYIQHRDIERLAESYSDFRRMIRRLIAIDAAIFRIWLASMGRRQALERTAHFICEQHHRQNARGVATADGIHLPLSQMIVGDMLGLSTVHINRSLQKLRQSRAIGGHGALIAVDFPRLARICGFDPSYLGFKIVTR